MLTVAQYYQHIHDTVFPHALKKLQQCADPRSIADWKKAICRYINEKSVAGEPAQVFAIPGLNPQEEESKDNLTMPQRVYVEALSLQGIITAHNIAF
jgi:hypothetical protein